MKYLSCGTHCCRYLVYNRGKVLSWIYSLVEQTRNKKANNIVLCYDVIL